MKICENNSTQVVENNCEQNFNTHNEPTQINLNIVKKIKIFGYFILIIFGVLMIHFMINSKIRGINFKDFNFEIIKGNVKLAMNNIDEKLIYNNGSNFVDDKHLIKFNLVNFLENVKNNENIKNNKNNKNIQNIQNDETLEIIQIMIEKLEEEKYDSASAIGLIQNDEEFFDV